MAAPHPEPSASAHPHAGEPVFDLHVGGKMEIHSTAALTGPDELSLAYTPGVARVCEAIAADPSLTQHYTWVPNTVAVVTDGTAVLGLGDIVETVVTRVREWSQSESEARKEIIAGLPLLEALAKYGHL